MGQNTHAEHCYPEHANVKCSSALPETTLLQQKRFILVTMDGCKDKVAKFGNIFAVRAASTLRAAQTLRPAPGRHFPGPPGFFLPGRFAGPPPGTRGGRPLNQVEPRPGGPRLAESRHQRPPGNRLRPAAVASQPGPRHVDCEDDDTLDAAAVALEGVQGGPGGLGPAAQPDDRQLALALAGQQTGAADARQVARKGAPHYERAL